MADKIVVYSTDPFLSLNVGKASDPLGVKITDQPDNVLNLPEPDAASMTVVAESGDASPLTYQWQSFDGNGWIDLSDGGVFSGVNTATMTISSTAGFPKSTVYRCEVSNDVNTVISNNAFITILLAVSFINGPVTPWDAVVGVETTRGPASDFFEGDQTPFTYAETGTAWPSWAVMDPNTGIITGTPDQTSVTNGMTVTATDTNGNTAVSNTFSLTVTSATEAISFSGTIPDIFGDVNVPITPIPTAIYFSGTEGPFVYSESPAGAVWPVGITVDPSTGVIEGTPLADGTVTGLVVRGTDQLNNTADSNAFSGTTLIVEKKAILPGGVGNYFDTPDNASGLTGDIDIRFIGAMDNWNPTPAQAIVSKYVVNTPNRSFFIQLRPANMRLFVSTDGANQITADCSVATPFAPGASGAIRVTWSDSLNVCNFYSSNDGGDTWVQLGTADVALSSAGLFGSFAPIEIGSYNRGALNPAIGEVLRVQILDGIDGTVYSDFYPTDYISGSSWTSATTGEVWTINGTATVGNV